jgi:hypothetical protein
MATKRQRLVVERLERRQLLAADVWFEDSGQPLSGNHDTVELGDLDGDGDLDAFFSNLGDNNQLWLNTQLDAGDLKTNDRCPAAVRCSPAA